MARSWLDPVMERDAAVDGDRGAGDVGAEALREHRQHCGGPRPHYPIHLSRRQSERPGAVGPGSRSSQEIEVTQFSGGRMKKVLFALATTLFATAALPQTNLAIPAGTALKIKLDRALTTFSNKTGAPFSGHVSEAITLDGKTIIPVDRKSV